MILSEVEVSKFKLKIRAMIFKNREVAGKLLAAKLLSIHPQFMSNPHVLVLGIPRGGVIVAAQVSKVLRVPLDAAVVRKLGVPYHPEFAFGAIDLDGETVVNAGTVAQLDLLPQEIEEVKGKELAEARRREEEFRGGRGPLKISGKIAIVVDDGVATGATAEAAIQYVLSKGAERALLAVPVIARDTLTELNSKFTIQNSRDSSGRRPPWPPPGRQNDGEIEIVYLDAPEFFAAVGQFYENFPQTSDEEVTKLLNAPS